MKLSKLVKDKKITWFSKMLFYEILDNSFEFGYYYYSTSYLSNIFDVSERTILNSLKELEENKYIKRETSLYDGKNQIKERKIYVIGGEENFISWCKIYRRVVQNFAEGSAISFSTLVKKIAEGSAENFVRYCKELHIKDDIIYNNNNNNIYTENNKVTFDKSIYFENYELFKSDFEKIFPEIDSKHYYDEYSLSCLAKGYKNYDWKAEFQKWINKLDGNYRKVIDISKEKEPKEKDISHYITLEDFMKFNHNATGIAIFINNAKDAIPNIIHILPEITHWKTLEYFCEYEFGVDDLNYKEANARIKYSPTHKDFFDYSIIDQQYYEEMKRKRKYIPYSEFKKSIGINKQV